jgi:predicted nuclease of predicted toxin-antitoxin system
MTESTTLYTDEDLSALVATLLRSRGFDITTVPAQSTLGNTDRQQLEFATMLNRCIITHNRVDFERLHQEYIQIDQVHCGIIVVPQKSAYEVAQRIATLVDALTPNAIDNQLLYA